MTAPRRRRFLTLAAIAAPAAVVRWADFLVPPARAQAAATPLDAARFDAALVAAALAQTTQRVIYDPAYRRIPYPGGDVPADRGVCSDVIIRAYRAVGIDLQKEVHEDMRAHFAAYPQRWGLRRPDSNIDHRRVPNLMAFFSRQGQKLPLSREGRDYAAAEIVCWDLGGGITHIGLATDRRTADGARPLMVHNIGAGPQLEDMLFGFKVIGRYRYRGARGPAPAR